MTITVPELLTDEQAAALARAVEELTPGAAAVTPQKVRHFTGILIDMLRDREAPEGIEWWARTAATGGLRVGFARSDMTQVWVAPSGVTVQL